jgi:Tripartite tricarboxylate transporter family receptor
MLISGGTVVSGDGVTVIPDGHVLIRDGRIAHVGPGTGPQEDEIVDASGQVVLPGVINTHAHGCVRGPFVPVASAALSETEVHTQLDRHLHGGETTVLCVCGFCLPREIDPRHPVRVRLSTSHTPANFQAADNKTHSTQLVHVPYRGAAPALADAVAGQVKLTISGMPPVVPFLQSGALKMIAVTSKQRSSALPSIPALAETSEFEDFDFTTWFGLLARTGTPKPIIDKLARATVAALSDPRVKEVLTTQAAQPVGDTPAEFHDFIRAEAAKYKRIVEITGVKLK